MWLEWDCINQVIYLLDYKHKTLAQSKPKSTTKTRVFEHQMTMELRRKATIIKHWMRVLFNTDIYPREIIPIIIAYSHNESESKCRNRMHKAGDMLLLKNKQGNLKTEGKGNYNKKTYCYKLTIEDGTQYFVKIFEDSKRKPTKISKKLYANKTLQCKMKQYLLIPAFKPQKIPLDAHTYEVVVYPFIEHCNLQDITLKALRANYINPSYHLTHPPKDPHTDGYKARMLKRFEQCVHIAIVMKDGGNGYVDMDISPDNFIITTDTRNAVDTIPDKEWARITDAKDAILLKIDHESMMQWKSKFNHVDKPMKDAFRAPEVNRKGDNGEFDAFDVEKANVYQYGATFVYVLYGQLKELDKDGCESWKSLPPLGDGNWIDTQWSPCYIALQWLENCLDSKPNKRPTYDVLLRDIQKELKLFERPAGRHVRQRNTFGTSATSHRQRRPNNFNSTAAHVRNINGAMTFVHTQQSMNNMRQGQRRRPRMNNFNANPSPQRQPMMQPRTQYGLQPQRAPQTQHHPQRLNQNTFQQRGPGRPERQQNRNNFGDVERNNFGDNQRNNFSQNTFSNSNKKKNNF
eukprot:655220_1